MSYELWCYKHRQSTPNPYVLLDVDSEVSSSVCSNIRDAFDTFGVGKITFPQRNQARPFYDILPVADLDNFCEDHPELLI